jgi:CRP-like cAMP-binding protein
MPIAIKQLRNIPLLEGLDEAILDRLAGLMSVRHYQRREFVLLNGQQGDDLMFLLDGRLQVVNVTEDGREVGIFFIAPGQYFGELSVIDSLPRSASVVAVNASQVALLPKQHARALIFHNPLVAERMLTHLALIVRLSSSQRMLLSIPNAFQRVYAQLLQFTRKDESGTLAIPNVPTHQEIAIMVNTSRETVSRAINALFEIGALEKNSRNLIVRDPAALKKAAESGLEALDDKTP